MRGRWELSEEELKYWKANCLGQTKAMQANEIDIVDLSREDITPYQVNQVLTECGWERYNEYSGIEWDRYAHYRKEGCRNIVLYVSTLTFEIAIYLKENMDKTSFKQGHISEMLKK